MDNYYFLEESDYLNGKLPDKLVLRPKLVLRSRSYPKSNVNIVADKKTNTTLICNLHQTYTLEIQS